MIFIKDNLTSLLETTFLYIHFTGIVSIEMQ